MTAGALGSIIVLLAACGGGGGDAPVATADTTPAPFAFVDQTGVAPGATMTSAPVTISGINAPAPVGVAGGSYSVGCTATYVATAGTIANGQIVCVRHTSAATPSTATDTTLTVGGVSDVFSTTTAASGGADITPAPYSFTDQSDVAPSSVVTSAPVTITGIDAPAPVTVAGGTYSVGCTATYVATPGTIVNGQTVCARHTAAPTAATATHTTLTVGGVSDVFTSTTAAPAGAAVGLLPFLAAAAGDVRLLDPTVARSGANPATVDTGLAGPAVGSVCNDCFDHAETFFTGTVAGSTVSNLHAARLAYARRGSGNDTGAAVYKVNLAQGASNAPVQLSSLTDACRIVRAETTDLANVDATAVVVERAGADASCSAAADNVAAVIRLDASTADAGLALPLALDAGNPLHALTSAAGTVTGYASFETGTDPLAPVLLVRRDANLQNPVTLLSLADTSGANLERADLTHLFVTAHRVDNGLELYRIETAGTLSPRLYAFAGFNAGNPIQDGLRDATHLYFSDANLLLRIPVDSTTENAAVITTLDAGLRIENRTLDASTVPGRVVFEAQDDSITVAGGVFSAATDAANAPATVLANNADGDGGFAVLELAAAGRAYINVAHHGGVPTHADALQVGTDGSAPVTTAAAYWAGSTLATSFDASTRAAPPVASIFLATRADNGDGTGTDTLARVDPATGTTGAAMGSVASTSVFLAVNVHGLGDDTLVRVEMDRFGALDYDTHVLAADESGSLAPLATTDGVNDLPLDSLQRATGNLCLLCL